MRSRLAVTFAVGLLATTASARVETFPVGGPLGSFGMIRLEIPDDWTARHDGPDAASGSAIRMTPPGDVPFLLLLTPQPFLQPAGPGGRCQEVRPLAENVRRQLLSIAEEDEVPLQSLRGPGTCGFFATITDRTVAEPSLEDFKYGTQGHAASGHALLTFTVLTNVADAATLRKTALDIVASARHVGVPESAETALAATRLVYPGKSWGLSVDLDGFDLVDIGPPRDDPGMRVAVRREHPMMIVTVFLETDTEKLSAEGYRRWYRENHLRPLAGPPFDVLESERNGLPVLEYSQSVPGLEGQIRHMNAFLVHDGVWMDVHASLAPYTPDQRGRFDEIFDSVEVTEAPSRPGPSTIHP